MITVLVQGTSLGMASQAWYLIPKITTNFNENHYFISFTRAVLNANICPFTLVDTLVLGRAIPEMNLGRLAQCGWPGLKREHGVSILIPKITANLKCLLKSIVNM